MVAGTCPTELSIFSCKISFFLFCPLYLQGTILGGSPGCKHHLQQDTGFGPPSEGPVSDSARRNHRYWRGRPAGNQWVPVPVPLWPVELLGPGREDRLRTRAESRSVCLKFRFFTCRCFSVMARNSEGRSFKYSFQWDKTLTGRWGKQDGKWP